MSCFLSGWFGLRFLQCTSFQGFQIFLNCLTEPWINSQLLTCWMLVSARSGAKAQWEGRARKTKERAKKLLGDGQAETIEQNSRGTVGHYHQLREELRLDGQDPFYNFLRITPSMFDELFERITPFHKKTPTQEDSGTRDETCHHTASSGNRS